jgi:hypothetical protein
MTDIPTFGSDICRNWCSSLSAHPSQYLRADNLIRISQTAKDIRGGLDTLVDVFERIESYFQRLEIHTEMPPTTEMLDTIIQIMVETLSILGTATREIKQSRMGG